jgi:hypothetical protein
MQCDFLTEGGGKLARCQHGCIGNAACELARRAAGEAEYEGMNRHEIAALRRNYGEPGAVRNLLDILAASLAAKQNKRR